LSGAIGARVETWRKDIIRAAALLEATIDFADEDVPFDVMPEVIEILDRLIENLQAEANGVKLSERIRDGFEVAIVGRPNAGKSTLLNQLAGRMAAITSEIAGTTRDVIEVRMDLAGLPVTFLDTAGIRKTDDRLEALGVDIAVTRAKAADIRLFLLETPSDELELESSPGDFWLIGKADQIGGIPMVSGLYPVSGLTGQGIPELLEGLTQELSLRTMGASVLTRERHRVAVVQALGALQLVKQECAGNAPVVELAAEELRSASRALEVLLGHIDVETLLGEIFASFCIGK
jgi:tRNA modification GTPase